MVRKNKTLKKKGGFVPSIGEPFSLAVSKFISPIALFAGYKFVTSSKTKKQRKIKQQHPRKRRFRGGCGDGGFCNIKI